MFAKFDEIPLMILKVIKETNVMDVTDTRSVGQRENRIPSHKHSSVCGGGGYNYSDNTREQAIKSVFFHNHKHQH